jgi:hypothetical protein
MMRKLFTALLVAISAAAVLGCPSGAYATAVTSFTLTGSVAPVGSTDLAASLTNDQVMETVTAGKYQPVQFLPSSPIKAYFSYMGFAQGDTVDVLLKFTNTAGAMGNDPATGQTLTDITSYINTHDGGLSSLAGPESAPMLAALPSNPMDLMLSVTAGPNDPFASFDFSNFSDSSVPLGDLGLTQVDIDGVVVPEPASLATLGFGAMVLLARRRQQARN